MQVGIKCFIKGILSYLKLCGHSYSIMLQLTIHVLYVFIQDADVIIVIFFPTAVECVCCCEIYQTVDKITEAGAPCIMQHEGFEAVCLNVWVLQTACFQYYQQYSDFVEKSANE